MPQLADIVTFSKRKESRKERLGPWSEFEPLFSQLRQATNSSNDEVMKLIGYSGATMLSAWKKEGVPTLAFFSAKYHLHDLKVETKREVIKQFTFDELTGLFAALNYWTLPEEARRGLIKKIAKELQND